MKLLYCIPSLDSSGGTERVLTNKVNYLAQNTNHTIFLVLTEKQKMLPFYAIHPSVELIHLDIDFKSIAKCNLIIKITVYFFKKLVYKYKLSKLLYEIKPDITTTLLSHEIDFLNNIKDGSVKIAECHFNKDFRLSFVKNATSNRLRLAIANWRNQQLINKVKKSDLLVTLTHLGYEEWSDVTSKTIISNALSFTSEIKSDCKSKKIVVAGRYTQQKGYDLLLQVWRDVEILYPDWELYIYGDGVERINLENFVIENKLNNVFLEHSVSDISQKFIEGSFSILPSRFEGFGMVIIEAMECGLPVIAFDCPCGPNEIISHCIDGFLVPPNNLEKLKDCICYMIENEEVRVEMGKKAALKASQFSNDIIMKKWIQLYQQIV